MSDRITYEPQGNANEYALVKDGNWLASVQLNGEIMPAKQRAIVQTLADALMERASAFWRVTALDASQPKPFTVLGVYENTGEAFAEHVQAATPHDAMTAIADSDICADDLCLIGAIAGAHDLVTPGDDNIATAYAYDMKSEADNGN